MDIYVHSEEFRNTVIATISLAVHFLTLKQEYMTMTTDNETPVEVMIRQSSKE